METPKNKEHLNKEAFARNIKMYRKQMGLNQQDIADEFGICRELVSYYENGERNVPINVMEKYADIFGIDCWDLFEEDEAIAQSHTPLLGFSTKKHHKQDLNHVVQFCRIIRNFIKMDRLIKLYPK